MSKISVIGTGYVGLVTGTCFAELGNQVCCIDRDAQKIERLNRGECPIFERGLGELIVKTKDAGRLTFSQTLDAVLDTDVVFIAVGTPQDETGKADLSQVQAVLDALVPLFQEKINQDASKQFVLVMKSTVPVGTCQNIADLLKEKGLSTDHVNVVSNPEFLRQGTAVNDFFRPDRVIIGGAHEKAIEKVAHLYNALYRIDTPVVKTNWVSSELIKYASNVFLATKISFINEISNLCDHYEADVHVVAKSMGLDGRIGKYFLHPGPGFGGSCFPKDTNAIIRIADEVGYDFLIAKAVEEVNRRQKERVAQKILSHFKSLEGKTIAMLGLAFKPNTDDMRDSPALVVLENLLKLGAKVQAFDPSAMDNCKSIVGDQITYSKNSYDAVEGADALVVMTEWHDFRLLDLEKIKSLMKTPIVFDTRNIYNPQELSDLGFRYYGTGRSSVSQSIDISSSEKQGSESKTVAP